MAPRQYLAILFVNSLSGLAVDHEYSQFWLCMYQIPDRGLLTPVASFAGSCKNPANETDPTAHT